MLFLLEQSWVSLFPSSFYAALLIAGISSLVILLLQRLNCKHKAVSARSTEKHLPNESKLGRSFQEVPGVSPTSDEKGNLEDIAAAGSLHQFLKQLHREHGDIAKFWWMKQPAVSIASPKLFRDTSRLPDRPSNLFMLFEPLFGERSMTYANGEDFAARKSSYRDKPFSHAGLPKLYATFVDVAQETIDSWQTAADDSRSLVLQDEMMNIGLKSIVRSSLGFDLRDSERIESFREAYEICWTEMESRLDGSFPDRDSQREKAFTQSLAYLRQTARSILNQRRAERNVGRGGRVNSMSFIDYLVEAEVPEQQALDEVITFLVGGFHTTAYMLTWAFYFLLKQPHCLKKLTSELDEVLGDRVVPTLEDINKLTYLNQCVSETLRCSVLAPWAARFSNREIVVGGYRVPAKTPIIQALGVSLHDSKLWSNPKEFHPERFAPTRLKNQPVLSFVPFGFAGKRICPGQRYAKVEGLVILSALLKRFSIALDNPELKVKAVHGLVTCPDRKILMNVRER